MALDLIQKRNHTWSVAEIDALLPMDISWKIYIIEFHLVGIKYIYLWTSKGENTNVQLPEAKLECQNLGIFCNDKTCSATRTTELDHLNVNDLA